MGMTTRILALVTDAYGMRGGIARYNRDLFEALAGNGAEVFVLPRHGNAEGLTLPAGIRQFPAVLGRLRFCLASLGVAWRCRPVDVVFCGHVFMAPFARVVARLAGARYWLQAHGTEVWTDRRDLVRRAIEAADMVSTVSRASDKFTSAKLTSSVDFRLLRASAETCSTATCRSRSVPSATASTPAERSTAK